MSSAASRATRAEGMAKADAGANAAWQKEMESHAIHVMTIMRYFTSDDVFDSVGRWGIRATTKDKRAFGPVMARLVKRGLCQKAALPPRTSNRASRHAAPLTVWESKLFTDAV